MALSVEVDIVGGCIAEAKAQKAVSGGVEVGRWWVGQGDLRGAAATALSSLAVAQSLGSIGS